MIYPLRTKKNMISIGLVTTLMVTLSPLPAAIAETTPTVPTPITVPLAVEDSVSAASLLGLPELPPTQTKTYAETDFKVAAMAATNHTADIAIVAPVGSTGSTTFISSTDITNLVLQAGSYWKTQTNNQFNSMTVNPNIPKYVSANACGDSRGIWDEAAQKFGHSGYSDYLTTSSRHLIVMVPAGCGGAGLGSLGTYANPINTGNGGMVLASDTKGNNLEILSHEIGHNLGLQHSNTHYCPSASMSEGAYSAATNSFSDGCYDMEYGDSYDVMASAHSINYNGTMIYSKPSALNATQKNRLGIFSSGEVQSVVLPTTTTGTKTTASLLTTGSSSGLRILKVTDPKTGQIYFVDYRGGTGMDAGSLYQTGYLSIFGVNTGVRVTTTRPDGTSVVLLSPDLVSNNKHKLFLRAGETLKTRSGGVTVTVNSIANGQASVSVTVGTLPTPTPAPTPTATPTATATPTPTPTVAPVVKAASRLTAADAYASSAAISAANYAVNAPVVYIASGANYSDALTAAPVAGKKGAPVLLVQPTVIPTVIQNELKRLKPAKIIIIGGTAMVSDTVKKSLATYATGGATAVTRTSGADRYATSAVVSASNYATNVPVVYLVNGNNYSDMLAVAPIAGKRGGPILLTSGTSLTSGVAAEIKRLKPAKIVIIGGTTSVSDTVKKQVTAHTPNGSAGVVRIIGVDRWATSASISAANITALTPVVYIANGSNYMNALSGAPVAAKKGAPILFVYGDSVPLSVQNELKRLKPAKIVILGASNVVSDNAAKQLATYIR